MRACVEALARLPGVWRGGELEQAVHEVAPTGHAALDRELPGGGWPIGTLSEVLHDAVGIGEVHFLCGALARASEGGRLIAWIGAPHLPYAPALAAAGIALERCLVIEPAHREDALWAAEQSLRSGACGAVLLWLANGLAGGASGRSGDYAWLRRLQLAAQAGRSMAVLYRSTAAQGASTPAHLRVALANEQGALAVRIPKRRGPPLAVPVRLQLAMRPRGVLPEQHQQAASQPPLVPADPSRPLPRLAA
ncbi:MAG TPA: translesion DNA synthesis-associated protein ImuA [Usitatibacter sp.]|nr:translesion DNA synthesis-associated protein ImuA [Usitatibacter sp.]